MSTALIKPADALVVSPEQVDLVRRTVAAGATPDELALYLFDCQRQGVHPLDKLLHFTKRNGKYTPITSIDFMRQRAAETGEMAGSDDPTFAQWWEPTDTAPAKPAPYPFSATATVYRLTQGQRFAYGATARWAEYYPGDGLPGFMWRKMPHTMLGKCAEALALRKGFPRQLAGLYAKEELDQAEAPSQAAGQPSPAAPHSARAAATGENRGTPYTKPVTDQVTEDLRIVEEAMLPAGFVRIERIDSAPTKNPNVTKYTITLSTGEIVGTINTWLASLAEDYKDKRTPVRVKTRNTKYGVDLLALMTGPDGDPPEPPPTDDDIPF